MSLLYRDMCSVSDWLFVSFERLYSHVAAKLSEFPTRISVELGHQYGIFQLCPGLNINEIHILYDRPHKVSSLIKVHQNTPNMEMSNNPVKHEVLIKQYLRSILDNAQLFLSKRKVSVLREMSVYDNFLLSIA